MRKFLLGADRYYSLLEVGRIHQFQRISAVVPKKGGTQFKDGALFLTSRLIPGFELYYDPSDHVRRVSVTMYPVYLDRTLFIGYVLFTENEFSITKSSFSLQLPGANLKKFKLEEFIDLHVLTASDMKSVVFLKKIGDKEKFSDY